MHDYRTLTGALMLPPHLRVLIVEDSASMRELLRIELQRVGLIAIDAVGDATNAIRALAARRYDLVVCDYNLEDGPDGQTLLDRARREKLLGRASIFVMLTAERAYSRVVQVVELAPDAYVVKPFSPGVLQERVAAHFARVEALRPALAALDAGEPARALAFLDRPPDNAARHRGDLLRLRVESLTALARHDEARAVVDDVLARATAQPPRWALLAGADADRLAGDRDAARAGYARLMEVYPHFVTPRDRLCDMAAEDDDLRGAQQWADRALELSATPERYRRVGELAVYSDQAEVAERAYREAFERARYSFFQDATDYAYAAHAAHRLGGRDRALGYLSAGDQQIEKGPLGELLLACVAAVVEPARDRALALKRDALALVARIDAQMRLPATGELCLAECLLKLDQPVLAQARLQAFAAHAGTFARTPCTKMLERARGEVRSAAQLGMTQGEAQRERIAERAIQRNNAAVQLLRDGRLDDALRLLEQAIADDAANPVLLGNLVRTHLARFERLAAADGVAAARGLLARAGAAGLDAAETQTLEARLAGAEAKLSGRRWRFGTGG